MNDRLLGLFGLAVKAGKVRFGVYRCEKAIAEGSARLILAAEDLGKSNNRALCAKCENEKIPIIHYGSKAELGRAAGRGSLPAAAVCDESFAAALRKIYGGVNNA